MCQATAHRSGWVLPTAVTFPPLRLRSEVCATPARSRMALGLASVMSLADDQRSVASLIEKLLTDYCKEKGFLTDPSKKRR
jgi:hypothetical protein